MSLTQKRHIKFANGQVYMFHTEDGYPIETTDTFLPFYTKDAVGRKQNALVFDGHFLRAGFGGKVLI